MIGRNGISLAEYTDFLEEAEQYLSIRRGGLDCTMYGGQCGAGTNNYFLLAARYITAETALIFLLWQTAPYRF